MIRGHFPLRTCNKTGPHCTLRDSLEANTTNLCSFPSCTRSTKAEIRISLGYEPKGQRADSAKQPFSHPALVRISALRPAMLGVPPRCDERIACWQFLTWQCHLLRSVPHRPRTRHALGLEMLDHREHSLTQRTNRKMKLVSWWVTLIHCLRKNLRQPSESNGHRGVLRQAKL